MGEAKRRRVENEKLWDKITHSSPSIAIVTASMTDTADSLKNGFDKGSWAYNLTEKIGHLDPVGELAENVINSVASVDDVASKVPLTGFDVSNSIPLSGMLTPVAMAILTGNTTDKKQIRENNQLVVQSQSNFLWAVGFSAAAMAGTFALTSATVLASTALTVVASAVLGASAIGAGKQLLNEMKITHKTISGRFKDHDAAIKDRDLSEQLSYFIKSNAKSMLNMAKGAYNSGIELALSSSVFLRDPEEYYKKHDRVGAIEKLKETFHDKQLETNKKTSVMIGLATLGIIGYASASIAQTFGDHYAIGALVGIASGVNLAVMLAANPVAPLVLCAVGAAVATTTFLGAINRRRLVSEGLVGEMNGSLNKHIGNEATVGLVATALREKLADGYAAAHKAIFHPVDFIKNITKAEAQDKISATFSEVPNQSWIDKTRSAKMSPT